MHPTNRVEKAVAGPTKTSEEKLVEIALKTADGDKDEALHLLAHMAVRFHQSMSKGAIYRGRIYGCSESDKAAD